MRRYSSTGPTPNAQASSGLTDKMEHLQLSDDAANDRGRTGRA